MGRNDLWVIKSFPNLENKEQEKIIAKIKKIDKVELALFEWYLLKVLVHSGLEEDEKDIVLLHIDKELNKLKNEVFAKQRKLF